MFMGEPAHARHIGEKRAMSGACRRLERNARMIGWRMAQSVENDVHVSVALERVKEHNDITPPLFLHYGHQALIGSGRCPGFSGAHSPPLMEENMRMTQGDFRTL